MRILQVAHGFPPYEWAGTELVTCTLSQALQARGHNVTVLARTDRPAASEFSLHEERFAGVNVTRVINTYAQISTFRLHYDNPFVTEPFLEILQRCQPDVVHFQHVAHLSVNVLSLAAARGYPVVLSLHDFFFACHRVHLIDDRMRLCPGPERGERCVSCLQAETTPDEARRRFAVMEEALRAPDRILVPSYFLAQKMRSYFPFLRERLRVIAPGIAPLRSLMLSPALSSSLRILCIGILLPHKGASLLLEACKDLPAGSTEVSLYGAAVPFWQSYTDRLHELARGLTVRFGGIYHHDELGTLLSQHDVVVVPSLCEETFSLVAREALVAGLPVVAARRGALPEVIEDGVNGLLFEPENVADLRRCLLRLITEPGLRERLRSVADPFDAAVKTVEQYARDVEQVYTEISAEPFRVQALQQRLAMQHTAYVQLQQEQQRIHSEHEAVRKAITAQQGAAAQEHERTVASVREDQDKLHMYEKQLQERDARLNAIYASITWKLYRGYAVLKDYCLRRPFDALKQWLLG